MTPTIAGTRGRRLRTETGREVSHEEVIRGVVKRAAVTLVRPKRAGRPATDPVAVAEGATLLARGLTPEAAAKKLRKKGHQISAGTIRRKLGGHGTHHADEATRAAAVEARGHGEKLGVIAARLGITVGQVANACERAGLVRPSKAHQKRRMGLCREEGCLAQAFAARLCSKHYRAARKAKAPPCTAAGCPRPAHSRGLCMTHYAHQREQAA